MVGCQVGIGLVLVAEAGLMDKPVRFWRWYRSLPIFCMAAMLVLSLGLSLVPSKVVRRILFPVSHSVQINGAAARHGVDPYLVAAVIRSESNWDASAESAAGAVGLMQLMPQTAQEVARMGLVDTSAYDPTDLTDPTNNIEYGTAYLAYLQSQLSTTDEVIAAYNAGLGAVQSWSSGQSTQSVQADFSSLIKYPETKLYVQRVDDAYQHYQQLYPEGLSDI
ncbi:MAG: lytic transglycosylase domain-containing protein [Atopobiaceae bacterium]